MSESEETNESVEDALRLKTFDSLAIKRSGDRCFLVVTISGVARVFANRRGQAVSFRHVWQIREWLQSQFQIAGDAVPVETFRS